MTELTPDGASLPGGFPDSFDPEHDHLLTPRRLKGLLHPIRVRLLNLLESDGPATASQLGRRIGESSGVTSYHLRILAQHGFIQDDEERSGSACQPPSPVHVQREVALDPGIVEDSLVD